MESSAPRHDGKLLGDMDPLTFCEAGHVLFDWIAQHLQDNGCYPVPAKVAPGDIKSQFPATAPEVGASMEEIFTDFERVLVLGLTP